jgi:hypothetical protein
MDPQLHKSKLSNATVVRSAQRRGVSRKKNTTSQDEVVTTREPSSLGLVDTKLAIAGRHQRAVRGTTVQEASNNTSVADSKSSDPLTDEIDASQVPLTALRRDTPNNSQATLPGSYSVHPNDYAPSEVSEWTDLEAVDTQPQTDPVLFEAELVDTKAEQRLREYERMRIREETMNEVKANASQAEVIDDTLERKKRRKIQCLLVLVTLVSVVVSITVGVWLGNNDSHHTITRDNALKDAVKEEFGEGAALYNITSPLYDAVQWMSVNDTTIVFPLESTDQRAIFRQRFVMCVLAFSSNYENWDDRTMWLENMSECKWSGLICDTRGRIIGISLGKSSDDRNGCLGIGTKHL